MAISPDGARFWPSFPPRLWAPIAPIRQLQLIQTTHAYIEVHYVMSRELSLAEQQQMQSTLQSSLGYPYALSFHRHDQPIRRGALGKYEDFVSAV